MSENTKIEWADHTFNPWIGCTAISPGCTNCYASDWAKRYGKDFAARTRTKTWGDPARWNKQHKAFFAANGRRQRVFCASLADVFDNAVPAAWRQELMMLIADTPNLDWLLLTKRIGNAAAMLDAATLTGWSDPWPNVWLGATIVNQEEADRDIPKLLAVPAAKRFLSMEPLLGPVDIRKAMWPVHPRWPAKYRSPTEAIADGAEVTYHRQCLISKDWADHLVNWVIVGGESGPHARPMHPDWARSLRDQCEAAGVPFLFKQWGEWHTACISGDGLPVFRQFDSFQQWVNKAQTWVNGGTCLDSDGRELKNGGDMALSRDEGKFPVTIMHHVGKKAAGRLLDGREWDGVAS